MANNLLNICSVAHFLIYASLATLKCRSERCLAFCMCGVPGHVAHHYKPVQCNSKVLFASPVSLQDAK